MLWLRRAVPLMRGAACVALAACGDSSRSLQPPSNAPVTVTVGATGGTIEGPGGARLSIPANALATAVPITIAQDSTGAPPAPGGSARVGTMFSLTPHGLTFAVPLTLTVPAGSASADAVLLKTNGQGGWEQLDTERHGDTITAAITTFSHAAVYCCFPTPVLDGPRDLTDVPENGFAIFGVHPVGYAPFTYQWFRGVLTLAGETNRDILINPAHMSDDSALFSVRVTDRLGQQVTSRAALLRVLPLPPVIVSQPLDQQVASGGSVTFSAASTSSVAQTVQWQRSNDQGQTWTNIPGATTTSYTLANADLVADNDARFRMRAGNNSQFSPNPVASQAARLTVTGAPIAPVIVTAPQSRTVTAGTSATFTVVATGTSLAYQWERAARDTAPFSAVAGATSASFTISNPLVVDDQAAVRVIVSNAAGTDTSSAAVLTVLRAPTLAQIRVAGGWEHSVGLRGNGTVIAWGGNARGQLGDGTRNGRGAPAQVTGIAADCSVATFAVGGFHNLAVCGNGDVWAWGSNQNGELGVAGNRLDQLVARRSDAGTARQVAASRDGFGHGAAVLANNPLASAWGDNQYGQLGDGLTGGARDPGLVANLGNVVRVAAGAAFSVALRQDGSVLTWGANTAGQLGNGGTTARLQPGAITTLHGIITIAAGAEFALAIDENGAVWAWGDNQVGQLGDVAGGIGTTPRRVTLPAPAIGIAAGNTHALALLEDGRVYVWGGNTHGELGLGAPDQLPHAPQLVAAPLPTGIVAIGAGSFHSLAVDANYDVWTWGRNSAGQLGDGTTQDRAVPAKVTNANLR